MKRRIKDFYLPTNALCISLINH